MYYLRSFLVSTLVLLGYVNFSSSSLKLAATSESSKPEYRTSCLVSAKICNLTIAPVPAHKMPSKESSVAACPNLNAVTQAYTKAEDAELAKTNQAADNLRVAAENSGEDYMSFDQQMNSLFASYNASVTNLYNSYLSEFKNCQGSLPAPELFQSFTP